MKVMCSMLNKDRQYDFLTFTEEYKTTFARNIGSLEFSDVQDGDLDGFNWSLFTELRNITIKDSQIHNFDPQKFVHLKHDVKFTINNSTLDEKSADSFHRMFPKRKTDKIATETADSKTDTESVRSDQESQASRSDSPDYRTPSQDSNDEVDPAEYLEDSASRRLPPKHPPGFSRKTSGIGMFRPMKHDTQPDKNNHNNKRSPGVTK